MQLTTMAVLEAQKAELRKSTTLTRTERDECLRLNAHSRAMLEIFDVRTLEEVEDIIAAAREVQRMEREIEEIKVEMAATRIQQEEMRKNANND